MMPYELLRYKVSDVIRVSFDSICLNNSFSN